MDPEEEARLAEERLARLAAGDPPPGDPPADPEPEPQDPPADALPEGDAPPAGDPPAPAGDPPAAAPQPPRGARTFEARIGELSADKRRLRSENERLQAELNRLRGAAAPAAGDPPAEPPAGDPPAEEPQRTQFATQEEFQRAVREEAARQAEMAAFNSRCNAVEDAGVSLGEERWKAAKRNLALLDDEGRLPFELLSVALETERPEQVLLQLGEDPDRAAALLKMTPTKRALEIAKMSTDAVKPPPAAPAAGDPPPPAPRSAAPDPVDPIRGRGAPPDRAAPSDADDDATWLKKREAQLQAKRIAEAEVFRKLA